MSADFTPGLSPYKETGTFRFWCQKVLPLVYDDSLSYYELLCKVVNYLNDVISNVDGIRTDTEALREAYIQLQDYVNSYFDNLDVQQEINTKLDTMASDGTLSALINPLIPDAVAEWLSDNLTPTSPPVDPTLSIRGAAADAKVTGDAVEPLGISENFTIDAFSSPTSYTIHGDFKSGDTFRIGCEFTKAGTGAFNCAVKDSANNYIKIFYGNETADITLAADTSILTFVLGKANTITALSADIIVLSKVFLQLEDHGAQITALSAGIESIEGQLIENVTIESQLESGYWGYTDGQPSISANYARTIDYVPDDCVNIFIAQSEAIYIVLLAYNNGEYVGAYNHNTKTFDVISALTSAYGDSSYDLSAIRSAFPGYRFKLNFRAVTVTGPLDPVDVGEKTYFGMDAIKPRVFTVEKDGSGDFTSLLTALRFAMMFMDAVVYVGDGEWNLVSEYGSALDAISSTNWGLYLKNRIRVIFSSNSKVTFHYTGSNTNVLKYFSPFNTGKYGFTLENLTLEASRCRYCVHDERGEEADHYECHYKNCNMLMDNTNNEAWTAGQCIGGGLGKSAYIDIDGCIFDSTMWGGIVSYHNCAYANSKSNINLHNSYFKRHGTFRLSWYGVSTEITTAYISGCSFASAIVHRAENESATTENTEILEWNNIVRS